MEAKDLLLKIRERIESSLDEKVHTTSPIMYDVNKMQYKVSFAILEKNDKGTFKRFMVTVDDLLPRQF